MADRRVEQASHHRAALLPELLDLLLREEQVPLLVAEQPHEVLGAEVRHTCVTLSDPHSLIGVAFRYAHHANVDRSAPLLDLDFLQPQVVSRENLFRCQCHITASQV